MCSKHPRYKAVNKPRSKCLECWLEYIEKHPKVTYSNKDITNIIQTMNCRVTELKEELNQKIEDVMFNHNSWKHESYV